MAQSCLFTPGAGNPTGTHLLASSSRESLALCRVYGEGQKDRVILRFYFFHLLVLLYHFVSRSLVVGFAGDYWFASSQCRCKGLWFVCGEWLFRYGVLIRGSVHAVLLV